MSKERNTMFNHPRWVPLEVLPAEEEYKRAPVWDSTERAADPKGYIVRCVMRDYLSEAHREILEMYHFEGLTHAEVASQRQVTEGAVRGMLKRAETNFKKALLEHAEEYQEVPSEEL